MAETSWPQRCWFGQACDVSISISFRYATCVFWQNHRKTIGSPSENCGLMGFYGIYPLAICSIAIDNCHKNSEFSHWKWWFSSSLSKRLPKGINGQCQPKEEFRNLQWIYVRYWINSEFNLGIHLVRVGLTYGKSVNDFLPRNLGTSCQWLRPRQRDAEVSKGWALGDDLH